MARTNVQVSLKITINERFGIRVQASVADIPHNYQGRVLILDVVKDVLSVMIRDGSDCEINVPGSETLYGRIQAVRPPESGSGSMKIWVATPQNTESHLIREKTL